MSTTPRASSLTSSSAQQSATTPTTQSAAASSNNNNTKEPAVYTVLRAHLLKDKLAHSHFESAAVAGKMILLGTSEGSLLVYTVEAYPGSSEPYRLKGVDCRPGFAERLVDKAAKKAILQLVPIPEHDVLLSLVDGYVLQHKLSELTPISVVRNCKGVLQFCVKKEKGHYALAVNVRKKILIYEYVDREFTFTKEFSVPEPPKTINWAGKNLILGFKKEYDVLDVTSPQGLQTEMFLQGRSQCPVTCNADALRELILAKDNVGIRVNFEGKPTCRFGVNWSTVPSQTYYLHPYIISLHTDYIEVHNPQVDQRHHVQHLPLKYIEMFSLPLLQNVDASIKSLSRASSSSSSVAEEPPVIIATTSSNSIYLIEVVKPVDQLKELATQGRFQEAIALHNFFVPGSVPSTALSDVHLAYALNLFDRREYTESMKQLSHCKTDPRNVLHLFSGLIPELLADKVPRLPERFREYTKAHTPPQGPDRLKALRALSVYLRTVRTPLSSTPPDPAHSDNAAILSSAAIDTALLRAMVETGEQESVLCDFLTMHNACVTDDAVDVMVQLARFPPLMVFFASRNLHEHALRMLQDMSFKVCRRANKRGVAAAAQQQQQAVVTAASCPVDLIEDLITKMNEYASHLGLTLKELEMVESTGDELLDNQIVGVVQTILYVQRLDGSDNAVRERFIYPYLEWILQYIPAQYSLQALWHGTDESRIVPPQEVLRYFDRLGTTTGNEPLDLSVAYVELATEGDFACSSDPLLHNKRVALYLRKFQRRDADQDLVKRKMVHFLETSTMYTATSLISSFSSAGLKEELGLERVILFRRMARHDLALDILVHERNDFAAALRYCDAAMADRLAATSDDAPAAAAALMSPATTSLGGTLSSTTRLDGTISTSTPRAAAAAAPTNTTNANNNNNNNNN
eukprot:PhM_4_TR2460/c2_g1_i1/m.15278/K20183/VPS39, VAM6; Vam6/Vps39-like protein vacuolar protein sorting-associated protein 39